MANNYENSEQHRSMSNSEEYPTLSAFVKRNRIKRNTLLKQLREYGIIDDDHFPYEEFEEWFEVRTNNPWTDKCFLSVTPKGEVELLKFANMLKNEQGVEIFN